jgi:hypothetical protein
VAFFLILLAPLQALPGDDKPSAAVKEVSGGALDPARDFLLAQLPAKKLAGDDAHLARLAQAIEGLKPVKLGNEEVWVLDKVPFLAFREPSGVVLDKAAPQATVGINKIAETLYLLFALVEPAEGPQAQCMVLRDDGIPTRFTWQTGLNAGPSIGKWDGQLKTAQEKPGRTSVALETKAKDGAPVRLFVTRWDNDNRWYGLTDLKWKLMAPDSGARLVILAVTAANAKK